LLTFEQLLTGLTGTGHRIDIKLATMFTSFNKVGWAQLAGQQFEAC